METNIERSLNETLQNSHLENITTDILEIGLDAILEEGILREIPIISMINGIAKTGLAIQEKIFAKKIIGFLTSINKKTPEQRNELLEKINGDKTYKTKVGETLLLILDKADNFEKPIVVGNLFSSTITGELSYEEFLIASHIVNNSYSTHLKKFVNSYSTNLDMLRGIEEDERMTLAKAGILAEIPIVDLSEAIRWEKIKGGKNLNIERLLSSKSKQKFDYKLSKAGEHILVYGYMAKKKKWMG